MNHMHVKLKENITDVLFLDENTNAVVKVGKAYGVQRKVFDPEKGNGYLIEVDNQLVLLPAELAEVL